MVKRIWILLLGVFCLTDGLSQNISLSVQTGHSATINKLALSSDGKLLASAGSDNSVVVWDIATGKQLLTLTGHTQKVNDLSFHPQRNELISSSDDARVMVWDLDRGISIQQHSFTSPVKAAQYSPDGNTIAAAGNSITLISSAGDRTTLPLKSTDTFNAVAWSPSGSLLAAGSATGGQVYIVRTKDNVLIDTYQLKTNQLVFSRDGNYLVGAGVKGKLRKWDVVNGGMFSTFTATADRSWQSFNCAVVTDNYLIGGNRNNLVTVTALASGKKIKVLNGHDQDVNCMAVSQDQKILVTAGEDKRIVFWDMETWDIIKVLSGTTDKINDIHFTDDGNSLVLAYGNGSFRYWQITPGGEMIQNRLQISALKKFLRWEYTATDIREVEGKNVTIQAYRIKSRKRNNDRYKAKGYEVRWDFATNEYRLRKRKKMRNTTYDALLNPGNLVAESESYKAVVEAGNVSLVPVARTGSVVLPHGHTDKVTSVAISSHKNLLATAGFDGLVRLKDLRTGKSLATLLASGERDYMFITPDNYYFSTKGALENIGFRINSQIYSFEQFDIRYNRPDIVLETLNYSDTTVTYAYRKAYEKRVSKSNVDVEKLTEFDDVPGVEILARNTSPTSKSKKYHFTLSAKPGRSALEKLFVSVNGVPLFPSGRDIEHNGEQAVEIELSQGLNRVMFYVTNTKGISSLKHSFQVTYKTDQVKPALYLVTIGASQYEQDKFNLKYAAKDATDIESLFMKSGKFSAVKKITLVDRDVTLDNIRSLKEFLAQATVDDMVLITYAGHGLLDSNLDYFLSTYNIDFENPAKNGLAFSEVEQILEGIKSRNKILMIDACHSGEIDKEEVELTAKSEAVSEGNISFRNVGPSVKNKNGTGLKTSFELSKTLFADIRSSHGAVIISSAGGGEYAIEGREWKNGIFTYCFINGLKSNKSDLNRDGKITVLELQQFLGSEVPRLTNGKQTPTSREENINNNFVIW